MKAHVPRSARETTNRFLRRYRSAYRRQTLVSPIIIFVRDFDRCLRFYRRVFGLRMLHHSDKWAELDAGGFVLSLHGGYTGKKLRHQHPIGLHFLCQDLKKTGSLVARYGGSIQRPRTLDFRPDELVTAIEARFRDPDGNEFELRQVMSIG